jgi:hypothetical protein
VRLDDTPNPVVFDFAVIVRKNISLRLDGSPCDFRMRGLQFFGDFASRFADDFDLSLDRTAQEKIGLVPLKRVTARAIPSPLLRP